ncbi:Uga4p [Sugiyamaella lignohabitans]|uniref:Uga4p n=1 Tax=Sugiyamaella lignohabitans TaxID=796027 RepID=A0A167CLF2_9ASCO|nr:Uga4p [Sugiyamaella lignohabitans]ANB11852.1 Uga4p [Sugiyamaella lignohabitans]
MFSEAKVFGLDFNVDVSNVRFRAVQWIVSEAILGLCLLINYLHPKYYKYAFRICMGIVILDFLLNVIWLPIGVSQTYGFQSADFVFTNFENETGGASNTWAWMLCFFATAGVQVGFDASAHVAEETKNASVTAAKGLIYSAIACTLMAAPIILIFLFCTPDLDVLFSFDAPQPFVQIYALALGKRAHCVMTALSVLSTLASSIVSIVAASRLVYAIARDGVLPFSGWISKVSPKTNQPTNAITFIGIVSAILLCSILPSALAFQSLVSISGVPTVSAWGLISFGRFFLSKQTAFKPKLSLGVFSKPFQLISFLWNTYLAGILFSPQEFPVTAQNLNYAPIIMGIVTMFALCAYFIIPEERWLKLKSNVLGIEENSDTDSSQHSSSQS